MRAVALAGAVHLPRSQLQLGPILATLAAVLLRPARARGPSLPRL